MNKNNLETFAPNGLLSDVQTEKLKAWFIEGSCRTISQETVASRIGTSRRTLYSVVKKSPERPFDKLSLETVNKLIAVYNEDVEKAKEERRQEAKREKTEKTEKEKAQALIKKVSD